MPARALAKLRDGLLSLAYPQQCRICGSAVESWDDGVACRACWTDPAITKILTDPICSKCGAPLAGAASPYLLCGKCDDLPFAAARSCALYSGAFEASILFLKSHPHVCPRLRRIIQETVARSRDALAPDLVAPVPLHRSRLAERGFNQASIIARVICRGFDLVFDDESLARVKRTERHRLGMDAKDRARSVERAFKVARRRAVENATVLLVDDLYTTGSTITAAASALLEAGARRVTVFTLARVKPDSR